MSSIKIKKTRWIIIAGLLAALAPNARGAVAPAQAPLFLAVKAAKPNIMLMIDNSGSMSSSVNTTIGMTAPSSFTYSCPSAITLAGGTSTAPTTVSMIGCKGIPMVAPSTGTLCTSSDARRFGSVKLARRCFDNSKYYKINASGISATTTYKGLDLNYYFSMGTFSGSSLASVNSATRITIAQTAANDLVDSLTPDSGLPPTVRMGLSKFSNAGSPQGGVLVQEVKDLDASNASTLQTAITGLAAESWTPLAETLSDIGAYFATGYTGNLTLKPGQTGSSSASVATVFNNHSLQTSLSSLASPIQGRCQKSFVVMVTDGLPTMDRSISTALQDYDGDCSGTNAANCTGCNTTYTYYDYSYGYFATPRVAYYNPPRYETPSYDMKKSLVDAGQYQCPNNSEPSDYLDDVAKALHDVDLRPDLVKDDPLTQKNNLTIYTVGLADPTLDPSVPGNNPLLKNTAIKGGGIFYYASGGAQLAGALKDAVDDLAGRVASSASVAANSTRLDNETLIYQARFDSTNWSGSLIAYPVTGEEGQVGTAAWEAAAGIPAASARNILTYNPSLSGTKGTTFTCANLSAAQKMGLGIVNCTDTADIGVKRLNYLRGDYSNEQVNPIRKDKNNEIRPATGGVFRNRTLLSPATNEALSPDPWLLGDIVNSNPVFVGTQNYRNDRLPSGTEGSSYGAFRNSDAYKNRRPMLYVGANDGMFHGFDARKSTTVGGKEIFAYVPNAVYGNLANLTDPNYNHNYFVDGSPATTDVYYGGAWHTVVLSTTGAGAKGIFALDVTNPSAAFTGSQVLWEISDGNSPTAADLTTDTSAVRGFAKNLGVTIPKPTIVRMRPVTGGKWAAIVANGYASANERAVLYIIDIQTGSLIRAIDTGAGSSTASNGLSAPAPVDENKDRIIDTIYAGDLLGNLWKFNVSSDNPSEWGVANGGAPLFVACDQNVATCPDTSRQPITSTVEVGSGPDGGVMIYFGTGKYFEASDNSASNFKTQTFYGIWDKGAAVNRTQLVAQTITEELTYEGNTLRLTSRNAVDYATKKGWYMDLLAPPSATKKGERVVNYPILQNGRIIFTTLIPIPPASGSTDICKSSDGTGWLMQLDAVSGAPLSDTGTPPFDLNGDDTISSAADSPDRVPASGGGGGGGGGTSAAPTGIKSTVGIPTAPTIVKVHSDDNPDDGGDGDDDGCRQRFYIAGSGDGGGRNEFLGSCTNGGGTSSGRQSWRQLQ